MSNVAAGGYGPVKGTGKGKGKAPGPYSGTGLAAAAPTHIPKLDMVVPATPAEAEEFLAVTPVQPHAQQQFREMDPTAQRLIINRGIIENANDLTAAFIGRMRSVSKVLTRGVQLSPGDWLCPGCCDTQFSRNACCRRCGIEKSNAAETIVLGGGDLSTPVMEGGVFMGNNQLPNLELVIPATPFEIEQFLMANPVEENAQVSFRKMDPKSQRMVINRGQMVGARDPTAAFIARMNSVRKIISNGVLLSPGDWLCPGCGDVQFSRNNSCRRCGIEKRVVAQASPEKSCPSVRYWLADTIPAEPVEVEQFLAENPVEEHAQQKFRDMDPKIQRLVLNRGQMVGARDPTAAFISRIVKMEKTLIGIVSIQPGDWICNVCGDHIFSRNQNCRRCNNTKPAHVAQSTNMPSQFRQQAPAALQLQMQAASRPQPQPQMQAGMAQMQAGLPQMQMQATPQLQAGMFQMQAGSTGVEANWQCQACGNFHPEHHNFCFMCGRQRT